MNKKEFSRKYRQAAKKLGLPRAKVKSNIKRINEFDSYILHINKSGNICISENGMRETPLNLRDCVSVKYTKNDIGGGECDYIAIEFCDGSHIYYYDYDAFLIWNQDDEILIYDKNGKPKEYSRCNDFENNFRSISDD